MQPLQKEILQLIRQEQLTHVGDKILVGVSGGPDSMALLHILVQLASILDITPAAAYVNHGLRTAETLTEKNLVETTADTLGIDFFTGSVDVKERAAESKLSVEHAARLLRYGFFEQTAEKWGAEKIAVGHTADDQAEEMLLRLIRGTGRKGLSGMKTMREGRVIRPFLRTAKSRLLAYLDKNSIRFLQDSSNMENAYLRNRIRNDLLPYLADHYNPNIRQTLLRTAEILQDEEELLEGITDRVFAEINTTTAGTPEYRGTDSIPPPDIEERELAITLERFNREPRAVQRRLLEKCCWSMGCAPQARQIEQLLQLAFKKSPGTGLHLSEGLRAAIQNEQIIFAYPAGRGPFRGNLQTDNRLELPETAIPGPGTYEFPRLGKKLVVAYSKESLTGAGGVFPTGEHLDGGLFFFPLTVRSPRPGDRFHPLGAAGSKKINDFLSDQKIAIKARGLVPVLCADESILALPGLRIDHRYRVTEKTTRIIRVSWEEH